MSEETIVLKVNDIVKNPYLACDYLFIEEKRNQLDEATTGELKAFVDFISENREQIGKILSSSSYKEYVNAQKGVKSYSEQLAYLETIATAVGDAGVGAVIATTGALSGVPVVTGLLLLTKFVHRFLKDKNSDKFVEELECLIREKHVGKRLDDYTNKPRR
ncbi:hypothetical protein ACWKTZ_26370 [Bacillus cereus]